MIELTWEQIRDPNFQQAVEKLMHAQQLPFKTGYHVSRVGSKIKSEAKASHEWFLKLVNKYADVEKDTGSYKVKPEFVETWDKEMKEFLATKFTIDKRKLPVAELEKVPLTPSDLLALEPVLYGLEVLEGVIKMAKKKVKKKASKKAK